MTGFQSRALAVAALACWARSALGQGGSLMRRDKPKQATASALQVSLAEVLKGEQADRLLEVEVSIRPSFEAFPKNAQGQIPTEEIFPSIVRNYFAKEHGWLVMGLEPPGIAPKATEVENALVLKDHAPQVAEALAKIRASNQGLALSDAVHVVATMEHLMVEEALTMLRDAYHLNELNPDETVTSKNLHVILQSFLLLFRRGKKFSRTDVEAHKKLRARAMKATDWSSIDGFAQQALTASGSSGSSISFEDASEALRGMVRRYGKWQNRECLDMKSTLMQKVVETGSGHIPFELFHGEPNHTNFQFTETAEYLRKIGVLEEAHGKSEVRIANYLLGPSNCIAPSTYYAVCCISECEYVISEIEAKVQSPVMEPHLLQKVIERTPSATVDTPRVLAEALTADLASISDHHEGVVPLHSADFKRWLHSVYPNECAYPTPMEMAAEDLEMKEANWWLQQKHECTRIPEWHEVADAEL